MEQPKNTSPVSSSHSHSLHPLDLREMDVLEMGLRLPGGETSSFRMFGRGSVRSTVYITELLVPLSFTHKPLGWSVTGSA